MVTISAAGAQARFIVTCGMITDLSITDCGRDIAPLHRAPWVGSGEVMPPDAAPHLGLLQGDFFCAPFGHSEPGGAPLHGWTANGRWQVRPTVQDGILHATLEQTVQGAVVEKTLTLRDGQPFLYQSHVFIGGRGTLPVANHAMVAVPQGGLIRTSAKSVWQTPAHPPETDPARGRSALAYPAQSADPRRFPRAEGGTDDLTRYPFGPQREEFVIGTEAAGHNLGWTAVTRPVECDLFLSLRNARRLPQTMLWHSHGGRDYAPWSGRHLGCLGVEEGAAGALLGADVPDCLTLNPTGRAEVRHVIGAIHWPSAEAVADIRLGHDSLVITGEAGARRVLPFDAGFLQLDG